jgi:hypothetical protein
VARREGGGFGRLARTEVIVPLLRGLILGLSVLLAAAIPARRSFGGRFAVSAVTGLLPFGEAIWSSGLIGGLIGELL